MFHFNAQERTCKRVHRNLGEGSITDWAKVPVRSPKIVLVESVWSGVTDLNVWCCCEDLHEGCWETKVWLKHAVFELTFNWNLHRSSNVHSWAELSLVGEHQDLSGVSSFIQTLGSRTRVQFWCHSLPLSDSRLTQHPSVLYSALHSARRTPKALCLFTFCRFIQIQTLLDKARPRRFLIQMLSCSALEDNKVDDAEYVWITLVAWRPAKWSAATVNLKHITRTNMNCIDWRFRSPETGWLDSDVMQPKSAVFPQGESSFYSERTQTVHRDRRIPKIHTNGVIRMKSHHDLPFHVAPLTSLQIDFPHRPEPQKCGSCIWDP